MPADACRCLQMPQYSRIHFSISINGQDLETGNGFSDFSETHVFEALAVIE